MGYASHHSLTVIGESDMDEITTELEDIAGHNYLEDQWSWREQDEHMMKLAKRFPKVTLVLLREGEESGDIQRTYYRHGRDPVETRPTMVWPDPPDWARKE